MAEQHWLVKQEPEAYSWSDFQRDGGTRWTGVRNYQARNHLRTMQVGDLVLFYHSVSEKRIVGIAQVKRAAYADPTATEGDWTAVDLEPLKPLANPVGLAVLKTDPELKELAFLRQTRLSVTPVAKSQFQRILHLAQTRL